MYFIPLCLFAIICGHSLVISAPINQNSQETKHQAATAIASHLLKELANEQLASQYSNGDLQQIESDDNEDVIGYIPTIDDLYLIDDNINDEELLSEMNDTDDDLPIDEQELMNYLEKQHQFDEDLSPMINTPIIDDSIMKAEDH
ncbi:unnamed protein product [Rotaria sordida]|uniref:Uncharacterized protein n=2 Tax=Rotaria sordida TaxID=392033 RepID=A0A814FC83_9BILA|nr:unnamed protein product [Rotaria sordida]CAF0920789.1 unnamed protein product [Rotaria sordida]CAF0947566.1 unnamed protein product [Rotaria sordida]CAF0981289.1 unnamed protein product [Rotaria sordida]CAF3612515.1 unnamed protein product [Rotaria sordida]